MTELERFTGACLEALYFTDATPDDDIPPDAELDPETRLDLEADCRSFWRRFGPYVKAAGRTPEQAGHDFWLTRNGHGAGFWDGDWIAPYDQLLDDGAKAYGPFEVYLGGDGRIHA